MPDDGRRYELVDGTLIVTPAPSRRHQQALLRLTLLLAERCPEHLELLFAPFDVTLAEDTVLQPDLLIAPKEQFTERDLPSAPLLVVEIVLPSTRHVDLSLKRARYEAAGCPSYWVIDLDQPSAIVWELGRGAYVERVHLVGDLNSTVTAPYAVSLNPAHLRN